LDALYIFLGIIAAIRPLFLDRIHNSWMMIALLVMESDIPVLVSKLEGARSLDSGRLFDGAARSSFGY